MKNSEHDTSEIMNLGALISALEAYSGDEKIYVFEPDDFGSGYTLPIKPEVYGYRGYYENIAFYSHYEESTVSQFLEALRHALDETVDFYNHDGAVQEITEKTVVHYAPHDNTSDLMPIGVFKDGLDRVVVITMEINY